VRGGVRAGFLGVDLDRSGEHSVHADAVRAKFPGQGPGEAEQAGFGGAVGGQPGAAGAGVDAGDVDDAAPLEPLRGVQVSSDLTEGASMSQPRPDVSEPLSSNLDSALRTTAGELVRGETKASILLAINSVGLGFVATNLDSDQPAAVVVTGAAGAVFLLLATLTLLIAVRPNPVDRSNTSLGWSRWRAMDSDELCAHLAVERRPETVVFLSRVVSSKFQLLRRAVNFILVGVTLVSAAGLLSLIVQ